MHRTRKIIAVAVPLVLFAVIFVVGLVWTVRQGIRARDYVRVEATVISCEKNAVDEEINGVVTVEYERDGKTVEAIYIGDLNRCYEGLRMKVYYRKSGDTGYVYSKSSDFSFALIMLCGGAVLLSAVTVVIILLYRAGHFL